MSQPIKVVYTARAHTTGGRDGGFSKSADGRLDVRFTPPGGAGTNPEQLFAAGWSGCYVSSLAIAAQRMKVTLPAGTADDVEVDLCTAGGGYFLRARHTIALPGLDHDVAKALVEAADQICPYSKATRGNIEVTVDVS